MNFMQKAFGGVLVVLASACSVGSAMAADYAGMRIWDSGPFTVWSGTYSEDPSLRIIGIKGTTKSISITFEPGNVPTIQYHEDHAEINLAPNTKLRPVGPHEGFILYCTNNGPNIWCYCQVSDPDDICDKGGIISGEPDSGWYDL
jgi:hypothetical protein